MDKSDETISTWTESYEPYEYEPEYDQSSLTTDQITQTTQGMLATNVNSSHLIGNCSLKTCAMPLAKWHVPDAGPWQTHATTVQDAYI